MKPEDAPQVEKITRLDRAKNLGKKALTTALTVGAIAAPALAAKNLLDKDLGIGRLDDPDTPADVYNNPTDAEEALKRGQESVIESGADLPDSAAEMSGEDVETKRNAVKVTQGLEESQRPDEAVKAQADETIANQERQDAQAPIIQAKGVEAQHRQIIESGAVPPSPGQ